MDRPIRPRWSGDGHLGDSSRSVVFHVKHGRGPAMFHVKQKSRQCHRVALECGMEY